MTDHCPTCDDLRNEVAYWRAEAERNATAEQADRLRRAFDLTPGQAWVLGKLYAAGGTVVLRDRLHEDMPGRTFDERSETSNCAEVLVHRIRRKAEAAEIETVRGRGYRLTAGGLAACQAALA